MKVRQDNDTNGYNTPDIEQTLEYNDTLSSCGGVAQTHKPKSNEKF